MRNAGSLLGLSNLSISKGWQNLIVLGLIAASVLARVAVFSLVG